MIIQYHPTYVDDKHVRIPAKIKRNENMSDFLAKHHISIEQLFDMNPYLKTQFSMEMLEDSICAHTTELIVSIQNRV